MRKAARVVRGNSKSSLKDGRAFGVWELVTALVVISDFRILRNEKRIRFSRLMPEKKGLPNHRDLSKKHLRPGRDAGILRPCQGAGHSRRSPVVSLRSTTG